MKIRIVLIGKNKDDYIEKGVAEFLKRLKAFAELTFVTLKEIPATKNFTKEKAMRQEGEEILGALSENLSGGRISFGSQISRAGRGDDFVVVLDKGGKQMTSLGFAEFIKKQKDFGSEQITFVIGGPYGLSEEVLKRANFTLSFSEMTFTHQMIRLILLEQLYRAFSIMTGKSYHY